MKVDSILKNLSKLGLFKGFCQEELMALFAYAEIKTYDEGGFLFYENMPREALYIVLQGSLAKLKRVGDEITRKGTYKQGMVISEGLLFASQSTHVCSAQVVETLTALELTASSLAKLKRRESELHLRLQANARQPPQNSKDFRSESKQSSSKKSRFRVERDFLGRREIPRGALWGIQTQRALENFPITRTAINVFPTFISSLAMVKKACALANCELELLDEEKSSAIASACDEIIRGNYHDQFVVDVLQGGAGTSTNMNANEVIANLALKKLKKKLGDYKCIHPNNHVNLGQSTNDVYPTAFRIALRINLRRLQHVMADLSDIALIKGREFSDVIKMGRTQLQDAVPMTLGQEFQAYAFTIKEDIERLKDSEFLLEEINMGATAIGTGVSADPEFGERTRRHLEEIAGLKMVTSANLIEATQDTGAYVQVSAVLKRVAVKLSKICNDLRLLSSGPRAGLGEINLPAMQPGSSIMPGKVNPVIPEVVNQVAFEVIGNDATITMAAEAGQLQLNAMEPVIVWSLLKSVNHLRQACVVLGERTLKGITANREVTRAHVDSSIGAVTALLPKIDYVAASDVAKEALRSGRNIKDIVLEKNLMTAAELKRLLDPARMISG